MTGDKRAMTESNKVIGRARSGNESASHFNNTFERFLRNGQTVRSTANLNLRNSVDRNQPSGSPILSHSTPIINPVPATPVTTTPVPLSSIIPMDPSQKAMEVFDHDRKRGISNQELIGTIMDFTKLQASNLYNAEFDLNNDRQIDAVDWSYFKEVASQQNHLFDLANKAISIVDANQDGDITLAEARNAFTSFNDALVHKANPSASQLLMDLDGNGSISIDDFNMITDVLTRKSRLGPNITDLSSASTTSVTDTILKSISNNQTTLNDAIGSMDKVASATWARDIGLDRQKRDVWQARILVASPGILKGREVEYASRRASLDAIYKATQESIIGGKDYWQDIRVKRFEYAKQSTATELLVRGASATDITRMDKLQDFSLKLDSDSTNYRLGYNIAGANPNLIKNQILADFSTRQFAEVEKLIQAQNANINKLDAAKTDIFNQEFDTLMSLHNQMQERLLATLSTADINLTDQQYLALNTRFYAHATALNNLLSTGSWPAPAP